MSTDIRVTPTDKIVLYPEDDGGARLERWTLDDGFRTIRLTKDEAIKLRDALGQSVTKQIVGEASPIKPFGGRRAIYVTDEPEAPGLDPDENEERQV
jgi:hypothetical protein